MSALGELFRTFAMTRRRRANFFAHEARQHGDIETNNTTAHPRQGTLETGITTAPENCTKNTHFSPAKAMTVSTPHRYQQAKATPVSGERAPAHEHTRPHWCGGRRKDRRAWLRQPWAVAGPGRASTATRPHWCGGHRRDRRAWLRRPWAVAGPGRASTATRPHWCGGHRRDRRARAGFEARRRTK